MNFIKKHREKLRNELKDELKEELREELKEELLEEENSEKDGSKKGRGKKSNEKGKGSFYFKFIFALCLILAVLLAGFVFYLRFKNPIIEKKRMLVDEQLSYCQELVTMKYRYTDIVSIKKSVSLSTSYAVVRYTGIIRLGIADVALCDVEVYNRGKSVRITIPAPEVLGNDIVSQSVFDEHKSIFVPLTVQEVFDEIDDSRQEHLDELLQSGRLLEEAADYAKKIITLTMKSCGFEEVIVVGGEH